MATLREMAIGFAFGAGARLEDLRAVTIGELQGENQLQRGRVVYGTIRGVSRVSPDVVATFIVDDKGQCARVEMEQNFRHDEDIKARLPRNGRIAVKQPVLMTSGRKGEVVLKVMSMACVEIITHFGSKKLAEISKMSAQRLRDEGNEKFFQEKYHQALELYGLSVEKAVNRKELTLAHSNKAECFLRLGKFESAIIEADKALALDEKHLKSLTRKAAALQGLEQHVSARKTLERAVEVDASVAEALGKAKVLEQQSMQGCHDISKFIVKLSRGEDCSRVETQYADYVGPVEIRMVEGRGRCTFACKEFATGDLILVTNPLSSSRPRSYSRVEGSLDVFVNTVEQLLDSSLRYYQFQALADKESLPSVTLFRPNKYQPGEAGNPCLLPNQVMHTIAANAFYDMDGNSLRYLSLLVMPSFLNHSCIPNVSCSSVGLAFFIRAAKNIVAGEELVHSYMHAGEPRQVRMQEMASRTFDCLCLKCSSERALEAAFHSESLPRSPHALEKLMDRVTLDEKGKQAVRCAHASNYIAAYHGNLKVDDLPPVEVVMAAISEFGSGQRWTLSVLNFLAGLASDKDLANRLVEEQVIARFGTLTDGGMELALQNIEKLKVERVACKFNQLGLK